MTDEKPSRNEEEYFAKINAELIKERRAALDKARAEAARSASFMRCPKCGGDLHEKEHHNIKIDVCASCNGVWLDAGEIDLLEEANAGGVSRFFGSMFGRR